jgi:hypothetical protein
LNYMQSKDSQTLNSVQVKELQRRNTRVCMQDSSNRVAHKYRRKNAWEKPSCPDNENDAAAYWGFLSCPGNGTQQNCRSFAILFQGYSSSESRDPNRSHTKDYLCS